MSAFDVPLKHLFSDASFFSGWIRPVTLNERLRYQGLEWTRSRIGLFMVIAVLLIVIGSS